MSEEDDAELIRKAEGFANALTATVQGVLGPQAPEFEAVYEEGRQGNSRLLVRTRTNEGEASPAIPITIDGTLRMELTLTLKCTWDDHQHYLAIEESSAGVRMAKKSEWLFRWEYLRSPQSNIPAAHFHMHAHRDEIVFLLLTGSKTNRRIKERAKQLDATSPKIPQLSDLHLPLGGPRFRPCLEDVLQFLVEEFGIDTQPDWKDAIREGRATWRRVQTGVVVRDCPDEAVRVLKGMGYTIEPPADSPHESSKLTMY